MKIWHFGDTHGYHKFLKVPKDIDVVIFSGDSSNNKNPYINVYELIDFIYWYNELDIPYKVFVAGNHETSIERGLITKEYFEQFGIIYLENDFVTIEGLKVYGSPVTPRFGDWAFMKSRHKLDEFWKNSIPDDVDVLVVHGPPKGFLDLSYNRENELEFCGCKSLRNHVLNRIKPKLCLFGHIHNNDDVLNQGTMTISGLDTIFSNGSVVTDRKFGTLSSHGNVFEL